MRLDKVCPSRNDHQFAVLLDWMSGKLDVARSSALVAHVAECSDCEELVAAQRLAWTALDGFTAPEVSAGFDARLYLKIAELEMRPWWVRLRESLEFGGWKPVVPVALAGLVLAVGFFMDHPASSLVAIGEKPSVTLAPAEADQMEKALDDMQMLEQFGSGKARAEGSAVRKSM